jgi:hypothetical protein
MSYYILPKKQITLSLSSLESIEKMKKDLQDNPVISNSVDYYINEIKEEMLSWKLTQSEIELLYKQYNPFEYLLNRELIHSYKTNMIYYIFIEILKMTNILFSKYPINFTICCDTYQDDILSSMVDTNKNNTYTLFQSPTDKVYIFSFLQTKINDTKMYTIDLLTYVLNILSRQSDNGSCIIQIGNIIYQPIIEIVYLLSILYNKIYIIKPQTSSVFTSERYIICKHFFIETTQKKRLYEYIRDMYKKTLLLPFYNNISIFSDEVPYYFINKIEESNLGIAHQQLEYHDILINIIYNKLCKDKLDNIQKNYINKCILWCDKYKVQYNKIIDKNIFLQENK